ncbi:MAG: HEPN domain-containing protein [Beijerinckiaceae bacterium]
MKPESAKFIEQANICLARADIMMTVSLHEDAARAAYFTSFHVAQAYIFERTGKTSKSHKGVQTEFFRLSKEDARADHALRRFLSQSYEFKSVADYFTSDEAGTSAQEAGEAIATAKRFVEHFTALVSIPNSAPDAPSKDTP